MIRCRNPYFIGILSAMDTPSSMEGEILCRNPYFNGILSAIIRNSELIN